MSPAHWPTAADLYQTMIEVIDPAGERAVTRDVYAGYVLQVSGDGRIAVYRESEAGVPYVDIGVVTLSGG